MAVRTRRAASRAQSHPRGAALDIPPWARIRRHRGAATAAHVTVTDHVRVTPANVKRFCADLAERGVHHIVTSAMDPGEAAPFVDAQFRIKEHLDVFGRALDNLPRAAHVTQRVRNRAAAIALDELSFGDGGLDDDALTDALRATTSTRFRVAGPADRPYGYAITGVAGWRGYVQRLAVHPEARRQGIGTALLVDGLRWARRRGARTAVVNTSVDNAAARALYESQGFVAFPVGLVVLELHQ
jgi:ribosomal protein S18 acetylase RimI-like enzyme